MIPLKLQLHLMCVVRFNDKRFFLSRESFNLSLLLFLFMNLIMKNCRHFVFLLLIPPAAPGIVFRKIWYRSNKLRKFPPRFLHCAKNLSQFFLLFMFFSFWNRMYFMCFREQTHACKELINEKKLWRQELFHVRDTARVEKVRGVECYWQ